jgi:hypothetical protein
MIADISLTHRTTFREGHGGEMGIGTRNTLERQIDHPDLWSISMGKDDLVVFADQICNGFDGVSDFIYLFLGIGA